MNLNPFNYLRVDQVRRFCVSSPLALSAFKGWRCKGAQRNMSSRNIYEPSDKIKGYKNVWVEFSALALKYKAVNIGQGFPDFPPPAHLNEALAKAAATYGSQDFRFSQYTRSQIMTSNGAYEALYCIMQAMLNQGDEGHTRLVNALASLYSKVFGRTLDPMKEIMTSNGAYEALYCIMQAMLNQGDEVILIEPFFDCYSTQISCAGGKPVYVPLRPKSNATCSSDWVIDKCELEAAFSPKTRAIVINTPHNPVGKVFKRHELEMIADLCRKHNVICISDEVYEWLVYSGAEHVRIATLPGMWDRTITVGSGGKTYSATGWKVGWTIGPCELIDNIQTYHCNTTFTVNTPLQEALAMALEHDTSLLNSDKCYFNSFPKEMEKKRDVMAKLLSEAGFVPTIPEGGYFMMADASKIAVNLDSYDSSDDSYDYKLVRWMTKEKNITAIPPSAFYCPEHKHMGTKYIRCCFVKDDSTLERLEEKLRLWKNECKT